MYFSFDKIGDYFIFLTFRSGDLKIIKNQGIWESHRKIDVGHAETLPFKWEVVPDTN